MSLWKIAWRSIQQRALASGLTALSMTLGVALVVAVLVIYGVLDKSFKRGAQGYDMIVGAKGSPLQLVLTTVYHLGRPPGTIPYQYYLDLSPGGRFSDAVRAAVPVCVGGNYKGFRVIGTEPYYFADFEYLEGEQYEFAEGRNFNAGNYFEAVIGSTVARETGLEVGDTFRPVHGLDAEQGEEHEPFTVVGILAPTGTPNDRALFVNIEGFYLVHEHEEEDQAGGEAAGDETVAPAGATHGGDGEASSGGRPEAPGTEDEELEKLLARQMTAVLVLRKDPMSPEFDEPDVTNPLALPRLINREPDAQAVEPAQVIADLFGGIVGNVQTILLVLAVLIVIVAGIGILVSIYNSMNDRRHEIAIMRALGARRVTVMMIILCESILLAIGGGLLGVLLGHSLTWAFSPMIAEHTGVIVRPWEFQLTELILVPGLVLLATAVGYLPAVVAYRTDVAQSLTAGA
ncbi:MAG TPA: ABC transporter permease [Planctomycetaceae bacterium]|nr:ABC transporter permease [Planctomycetaceae bacterium]HIQ19654.1 ABC transporter permease [Planctomycetota bacterium]